MNSFAETARRSKAEAMAAALAKAGISEDSARLMTDPEWASVAKHAGVNPPHSDETKDAVYELLDAKRHRRKAS